MANENESVSNREQSATFTSDSLRNLILDHVLDDIGLFVGDGPDCIQRLTKVLDSLTKLGNEIAGHAIANRMNLSALPTFDSVIKPDPNHDVSDTKRYEVRFRLVEQVGNNPPYKDDVMTRSEAESIFGESYLEQYWGSMGERCPNSVTNGDRTLWFSAVRYPVNDQSISASATEQQRPYRSPAPR